VPSVGSLFKAASRDTPKVYKCKAVYKLRLNAPFKEYVIVCKYMRSKEARYFEHKMMFDKNGRLS